MTWKFLLYDKYGTCSVYHYLKSYMVQIRGGITVTRANVVGGGGHTFYHRHRRGVWRRRRRGRRRRITMTHSLPKYSNHPISADMCTRARGPLAEYPSCRISRYLDIRIAAYPDIQTCARARACVTASIIVDDDTVLACDWSTHIIYIQPHLQNEILILFNTHILLLFNTLFNTAFTRFPTFITLCYFSTYIAIF